MLNLLKFGGQVVGMAALSRPYNCKLQRQSGCCAAFIALMLCLSGSTFASGGTQSPAVNYTVRVLSSTNNPELYNSPEGLTQWHAGLPILTSDTIQVLASTVDTSSSITELSAKIDGKPLPVVTQPEWTENVAPNSLQPGGHVLEITASVNKRHSATLPLKFTSVAVLPQNLVPPPQPVVTSVKGDQQLLQQGNVANVDPSTMIPPVVGTTGQLVGDTGVDIAFNNDTATSQRKAGESVTVNGELMAVIEDSKGSQDKSFVFMLVRDGNVIYSSKSLIPVAGAGIKLVAATDGTPGLLPGEVHLYVWGVDSTGNYSAPAVVDFNIKNNLSPVLTKP